MNSLIQFKKAIPQIGFFSPPVFRFFLTCGVTACLMATGTLLAVFRPEVPAKASNRTLTFTERVAYQRVIEDVYWRHRIWPKERPDAKPSLDAVMSQAQLEKKVEEYLSRSRAFEDYWRRPITAEQLQAEMDRMAENTKQPEVLRELFEAVGNDPFVIAECLARPVLTERLNFDLSAQNKATPFTSTQIKGLRSLSIVTTLANVLYTLPKVSQGDPPFTDNTWAATSTTNASDPRDEHTAVWTGSEMVVWGGSNGSDLNTGGRYTPSTDSWAVTSVINAPAARRVHSSVWTGSEMVVWGGLCCGNTVLNTGGRYNPGANSWTATSTVNAPSARSGHTAVWADNEMIIWGGADINVTPLNTGGRYNPSTNSWTATNTVNAPSARYAQTAVWTGDEMIIWGGWDFFNAFDTGGRYNPGTNSWTATSTTNAPSARVGQTAVWTGSEMIIWGGDSFNGIHDTPLDTGGRYTPSTNSWSATSTTNAPSARGGYTTVWTGSEMIIWGGADINNNLLNTGGRYTPSTNSWSATSTTNAPSARFGQSTVWTGDEMIIWGGFIFGIGEINTGGRYYAQSSATPTPTPTPPLTGPPVVTTNPATFIASFSATLDGSLDPHGLTTAFHFQYGRTTSYGFTTAPHTQTGNTMRNVRANISSLTASTIYHFRIVASNADGTRVGSDRTFTTRTMSGPPVVTTNPATNVTTSAATLNGSLDPHGLTTTGHFQYGTTTNYGHATAMQSQTGDTYRNIAANISGLAAHITYHFRIVATNGGGTSTGGDRTFTAP